MRQTRSFLVVADASDQLLFLSTTLHRKFPNSLVHTCRDSAAALEVAQAEKLDAIVAHRSCDLGEVPLIKRLRTVTQAPIIAISSEQNESRAQTAGACRCLPSAQWLLVGAVVAEAIGADT